MNKKVQPHNKKFLFSFVGAALSLIHLILHQLKKIKNLD